MGRKRHGPPARRCQAPVEPAHLVLSDAAGGAAGGAGGIQDHEAHGRGVVDVVSISLLANGCGEFIARERPPPRVWSNGYVGTCHEPLRPAHESFEHAVAIQAVWQAYGLWETDHRPPQAPC